MQRAALGHSYGCRVGVNDSTDSILSQAAKLRTRFRREYRLIAKIKSGCLLKQGSDQCSLWLQLGNILVVIIAHTKKYLI